MYAARIHSFRREKVRLTNESLASINQPGFSSLPPIAALLLNRIYVYLPWVVF